MNYKMMFYTIGRIFIIMGLFVLLSMFVAIGYGESCLPYIYTALIFIIPGVLVSIKKPDGGTYQKTAAVSIGLAWILISLVGALLFVFSGTIKNFINAFFEMVSGITATAATTLSNAQVDLLPKGIAFFRCMTNWIGGMGILVFLIALMPSGERSSMQLLRAESSGSNANKTTTKLSTTTRILFLIYVGLTLLQFVILLIGGLNWFDSITISFGTAGTGGFAPNSGSIAGYNSLFVEITVAIFMFIFAVNFNLFFLYFVGKGLTALKNEEFWVFFGIVCLSILLIAWNITASVGNFWTALRYAFFEVSAVSSSTGYIGTSFTAWPTFSKTLLTILMLVGGCAGSTAGGLKVTRLIGITKASFVKIKQTVNPRKLYTVKVDGKAQDESYINGLFFYFTIYVCIIVVFTLLISLDSSFSINSAFSTCLSIFNNAEPGIELISPLVDYAGISAFTKIILSILMLIGRLEIFPILILFMPSTWRRVNAG